MKFNYQKEKMKYIKRWEQLEIEYREADMSEEAIMEMKNYDWNMLKKHRVYCRHNQLLSNQFFPDGNLVDETKNGLLDSYFESFSYEEKYFQNDRYGWIEEIENEDLLKKIKLLDKERLDLLTMYVFEHKTHEEIAKELGVERSLVTKRLKTIKKFLKI